MNTDIYEVLHLAKNYPLAKKLEICVAAVKNNADVAISFF